MQTDAQLRDDLRESVLHLDSVSDKRHAASLAAWHGDFSEKQRNFARVLVKRAGEIRARGGKPRLPDIFGQEASHTSTPSTLAPAALDAGQLETIITRVLTPAVDGAREALSAELRGAQEVFNKGAARVIAQQVLREALRELAARVPREVRVTVTRNGQTSEVSGHKHPQFEHLLRAASVRLANGYAPGILLAGEAGSGKTHGTKMLADALGLAWHFNGAISFPHEMLGFIDAGGRYHTTPFRQAYEHGGVYTFDEVDRSDAVALLAVNPHLANGLATFPDGQVKRHPDCIIVATANTWGHGADAHYSGATKLDAAFLSRFPVRIAWDVDEQLESALVASPEWLAHLRAARTRAREAGLRVLIDTRSALAGAALLAQGYSIAQCAEMTYLASMKPDQRRMVEGGQ